MPARSRSRVGLVRPATVVLFVLLPALAHGQAAVPSAAIAGVVSDPSGAPVAQAQVTARHAATNQAWSVRSDGRGRFRFPALPLGVVELRAAVDGFAPAARTVVLTVGTSLDVPLALPATALTEQVSVRGEPALVAATRTSSSDTVTPAEIEALPLNGRNYLDLALIVPGVSRTNTGSSQRFAETSAVPGTGLSVSGQRNIDNTLIVDGVSANDDAAALAGTFYSEEVIREFQVVRSGGGARFGRASSGAVNIVTNSGTNDLHGRAYGFFRDDALDARNPLAARKDDSSQQQFGLTASGPIRKDRSFLFGNVELTRNARTGLVTISPAAAGAINAVLDSRDYPGPPVVTGSFPTGFDTTNLFVRADHQAAGTQIMARYSLYDVSSENARGVGGLSAVSRGTRLDDRDQSVVLGATTVRSSSLVNDVRAQWSRSRLLAPVNDAIGPAVTISGVASLGTSTSSPTGRALDVLEVSDTLSAQRGAHLVQVGGAWLHNRVSIDFPGALQGAYTFPSLAAFLEGRYVTFQQAFGEARQAQSNPNLAAFVQDTWQATSALTVDLGLRYDLQWLAGPPRLDRNNVGPRAAFAWAPGRRALVVRGSVGRSYDRIPLRALSNALQRDGTRYAVAVIPFDTPGAPTFPARLTAFPPGLLTSITTIDPAIDQSGAWQAAVGVERQVGRHFVGSMAVEHLRARGLIMSRNVNVPTLSAAEAAALGVPNLGRPDPRYANVSQYESLGRSQADSLLLSARTRSLPWGELRASYALARTYDDAGNFFFSSPQDNGDVHADWGPSDNDQRHRLVLAGTVQAPPDHQSLLARALLGCQVSWLFGYASALPFNPLTGTDTNNDTNVNDRPAGMGRNSARGFAQASLDLRLSRRLRVHGGASIDVLAEAFNVLNRANLQLPNAVFGTGPIARPGYGRPTAAGDPRQLQAGIRVGF